MAGWFGTPAAVVEFDKQIEEATSSSLSNLALNLEIADTIRSKTIPPKSAMQSLKKRLNNTKNPNIQLSTLELIDQSVKNGGTHFMQEIASREFMDNLVSLVKYDDGRGGMGEREVRTKMLELIQTWAGAAQGRESLSYITEIYRSLQSQGFNFPPQEDVASALFDSNAPPEWTDSEVCMRCREKFTFTNRKHHCRNCGNVFDQNCSSKSLPLPHLGIMVPVRVDDGCYAKLSAKSGGGEGLQSPSSVKRTLWEGRESSMVGARSSSLNQGYPGMMQPRSARVEQDSGFDADLKRALEMSLEDSKGQGGTGYVPQVPVQSKPAQQSNGSSAAKAPEAKKHVVEEGELDADLEAAIAASLKDMETQKTRHARELKDQSTSAAPAPAASQYRSKNQFELTPVEGENINLFATLVDRLQHQPPGTILREPQIQELYESIGTLRPKLARTYGETMSKHDTLLDLHSKLSTVVRYYDRMLEERMANAYAGGAARYGQPQRNSMYPGLPPAGMARPLDVGPAGGVESYYSGGALEYGQQQAPVYGGYPPQQQRMSGYGAAPPAQEGGYYQQQTPQQQHQSPYPSLPPQQQQNAAPYPSEPQQQQQQPPMHRRPSQQAYSQTSSQYAPSHTSQSSNPAISSPAPTDPQFYYEQQQQQQPPSPEIYHQPPPQQQAPPPQQQQQPYPTQAPQQLQQPPGLQRQGSHQHAPQQPPQYYAQSQPQAQQQRVQGAGQQQQWPQAPATGQGYGQEAFPQAPQHVLTPVAVKEESLIEL
ncbi:Vacuolar protein-sorting-associated protein 27 [Elasticomyces elasticus]|nr:Vacuolar protein-sorting-associated protein 27 [Elasticomyces elasticus]KAK4976878.1 Vacuolar protein-sorting-associated protein 27 [Elasticomyces elasticus]